MKLTLALSVAAAALLALGAATAAELPSRHTQPAPAAKTCRIDGQAGVILPGSETCMRVSGSVNAQISFGNVSDSRQIRATAP